MKELVLSISSRLSAIYDADESRALSWWILEELTNLTRTQLQFDCKNTKNIPNDQTIDKIIERLLHFEPIQYIFGHTHWYGLDIKVTPATLIPRPETAELVNKVESLKFKVERPKILDIGTGSGCIAIALKKAHPEWQVTGIDISEEAIGVAKENARRNGVKVEFKVADIFDFNGTFDVVVSNPPYICEKEKKGMRRNVLDYEPQQALFVPDNDPLLFYRRIASMRIGQQLFFEINEAYPQELTKLLEELGYTDIQVTNDIYGKPRIIEGRMA